MARIPALLLLTLTQSAVALGAATYDLPAALPLTVSEIALEVDFAGVEIVVDPRAAPALEAGLYADVTGPAPRLEAVGDGGVLRLRRAAEPEGRRPSAGLAFTGASSRPPLARPW